MSLTINPLTIHPVVYAVYIDGDLVHLGEGDSIARPANYVDQQRKKGARDVLAKFVEVTQELMTAVPVPKAVSSTLYLSNLERLLQAGYYWQYGQLPAQDKIRGGKGTSPNTTGGYFATTAALMKVFELLEGLLAPTKKPHQWPSLSTSYADLLPPDDRNGPGRPATRDRHLAFWVDVERKIANVGYVPLNGKQPHYASAASVKQWIRPTSPNTAGS